MRETVRGAVGGGEWRGEGVARDVTAFLLQSYHSPSKVLKLEDDPWGSCAMYSPDKMKSGGGLMAPPGCFPGRYSPTYRSSDPRRCVPNPSVSTLLYTIAFTLTCRGRRAYVALVDVAHSAASRRKHHRPL
ncbi:unnamed protein product [Spodoptera exigua]|nr:unnamed protein product [Spodoptera exigua]